MLGQENTGIRISPSPNWSRTTGFQNWNRYAAVNDEFIDLHMFDAAAIAAGQPATFGMGNLRVAYHYAALESALAPEQRIWEFQCRFTALNFAGDTLTVNWSSQPIDGAIAVNLSMPTQDNIETTPATAIVGSSYPEINPAEPSRPTNGNHQLGQYLDQKTIDLVGTTVPPDTAYPVDANDIRRWYSAVWYPYASPITPPNSGDQSADTLVAAGDFNPFAWHPTRQTDNYPWMRGMGTEPGYRGLNGGIHHWHYQDIRPGDILTSTVKLVDAYEKSGSAGPLLFLIDEDTWTNQTGQIVRIAQRTTVYY